MDSIRYFRNNHIKTWARVCRRSDRSEELQFYACLPPY